jgi:hypothetical protein
MRIRSVIAHRGNGWLEALLLPALAVLLTRRLDPGDPLLLRQPFPWLLLIPLLIALRYEFLPALLSGLVLASTVLWHPYPASEALTVCAGVGLVTLIAAEYASYWSRREAGRALQDQITGTRLRQLADDLYVTRVSLDRLEQSLLYQPVSARSALQELQRTLAAAEGEFDQSVLSRFLYFLNQLSGVQRAAWYRFGPGETQPRPLASLGEGAGWQPEDPVLRAALAAGESRCLADLDLSRVEHYLAVHVHPGSDAERQVLCIEDMSFFAINREQLQVVEVLFQYLCGYRAAVLRARPLCAQWPDCPVEFATVLLQLERMARLVPQAGMLIRHEFQPGDDAEQIITRTQNLRRGMDMLWVHRQPGRLLMIALLPFAGTSAAEGYLSRIEGEQRKYHAESWARACRAHHLFKVDARDAAVQLREALAPGGG